MNIIQKTCEGCLIEFQTINRKTKFCTYGCSSKHRKKKGQWLDCQRCKTAFYAYPYEINSGRAKFCSMDCHNQTQKEEKAILYCKVCQVEFIISSGYLNPNRLAKSRGKRGLYCSQKCCRSDPDYAISHAKACHKWRSSGINKLEASCYEFLSTLPYVFEKQRLMFGKFCVDAYFPDSNLVVQIDGDYWHGNQIRFPTLTDRQIRQQSKDRSVDAYLTKAGCKVIRLWESDIRNRPDWCINQIRTFIKEAICQTNSL